MDPNSVQAVSKEMDFSFSQPFFLTPFLFLSPFTFFLFLHSLPSFFFFQVSWGLFVKLRLWWVLIYWYLRCLACLIFSSWSKEIFFCLWPLAFYCFSGGPSLVSWVFFLMGGIKWRECSYGPRVFKDSLYSQRGIFLETPRASPDSWLLKEAVGMGLHSRKVTPCY